MKLEDLRNVANERTKGEWVYTKLTVPGTNFRLQIGDFIWPMNDNNAEFIALAANTYDLLLDIAEAAKQCIKFNRDDTAPHPKFFLQEALEKLEKL